LLDVIGVLDVVGVDAASKVADEEADEAMDAYVTDEVDEVRDEKATDDDVDEVTDDEPEETPGHKADVLTDDAAVEN